MLELQMKGRGLLEAEKNLQLRKLLSKKNMAAVMAKKKPVDMKNVDQKEADSSGSESIGIDTNKAETQTAKSGNEVYSYDVQSLAKSSKRRSRAFQVVPRAIEEDDIARESFQDWIRGIKKRPSGCPRLKTETVLFERSLAQRSKKSTVKVGDRPRVDPKVTEQGLLRVDPEVQVKLVIV
eukprot:g2239.t1